MSVNLATKHKIIFAAMLLSAVSAFWMLKTKTLGNHECFVSVTAREMLQSGDLVWPTCNGQPRLNKTPLSYWLVALVSKVGGEVNEFTARLPSAFFAVLSVAAILYFVSRSLSLRIAAISAGVWLTSLAYVRYSHNARAEMILTFFIMLCFLSFYSAVNTPNRKRRIYYMLLFWASFALANLAKGPAPIPLIFVPLFFYVAVFRLWKKIPQLLPVWGSLIFVIIVLPWPLAIAGKLNWDLMLWKREFVDRFFGGYASGDKAFYYYFPIMFQFIVPWVAFLPMALAAPFFRVWGKRQKPMQFLWFWFVIGMAFLAICGGKRQHYILPLMPAAAILIGIILEDMIFARIAYDRKSAVSVLKWHVGVIMVGVLGGVFYVAKAKMDLLLPAIILGVMTLVVIAVILILFARGRPVSATVSVFAGVMVLIMASCFFFIEISDSDKYSRDFSRELSKIVPASEDMIAYEYISTKSVHYFGRVVPEINDISAALEYYENGDWVVATAEHLEKLEKAGKNLRRVYYEKIAERRKFGDAEGALFHKSAAIINQGNL